MRKSLILLVLLPLLLSGQVLFHATPALNYWVDSVNGSDSNPPGLPYATVAHLTTVDAAHPRPVWNFHKDSVFHEQALIAARNGMTAKWYGAGTAMPLFDCSDPIAAGGWSKTGGYTNVYQVTLTIPADYTPSNDGWWVPWFGENDTRFHIKYSIADVDSNASTYYPTLVVAGTVLLYAHTSDGSNPGTNGRQYAYSDRGYGVYGVASNLRLIGLWARRNMSANGSINLGWTFGYGEDLLAQDGNKHNIIGGPGSSFLRVEARDAYYDNLGSVAFIVFGGEGSQYVPGAGTLLVDSSATGLCDGNPCGFYMHGNGPAPGTPLFSYLNVKNWHGALGWASVNTVTVDGSTILGASGGNEASAVTLTNTSITNTLTGGSGGALSLASGTYGGTTVNVTLDNVVLTGPDVMSNVGLNIIDYTTGNAHVTNSVVDGFLGCFALIGNATFYGRNNICNAGMAYVTTTGTLTADSDYNILAYFNRLTFWGDSGGLHTYTAWLALPEDTHNSKSTATPEWNFGSAHLSRTSEFMDLGGLWEPIKANAGVVFNTAGMTLNGSTTTTLGTDIPALNGATAATFIAVARWEGTPGGMSCCSALIGWQPSVGAWFGGGLITGKAIGYLGTGGDLNWSNSSTTSIDDGNWHSVAMIYDGTGLQIYVDGVAEGAKYACTGALRSGNTYIAIGQDGVNANVWNGTIAYAQVLNSALDATAMAAKHAALKTSLAAQGVTLP